MSLYEQFHSDINKKYMFDMIKKIVLEETKEDISTNSDNYEYFLSTFKSIFENGEYEDISEINKDLLNKNANYFINNINEKNTLSNNLNNLLQEREKLNDDILSINSTNSSELTETTNPNPSPEQEPKQIKKQIKTISINSSKRTNINSSRYNYKVNLLKNEIQSKDIQKITKIILPIEDNYLFNIPILSLSIPELDCNVTLYQDQVIDGLNRKFGIYKTIEEHTITSNDTDLISIDIRDITGTKYINNDILKVNVVQVKNYTIVFTCSEIYKDNYKAGDNIKIINNNTYTLYSVLNNPLMIKKIDENQIYCKLPEKYDETTYDNIDMKIMNMSNQNIIYFN
tara:strand:- start:66 stop:1091 length:1026 start_codon:yes stop_codon:yes gene_type:complete